MFMVFLPSFINILFASKVLSEKVKFLSGIPFNLKATLSGELTFKIVALIFTYNEGVLNGFKEGLVMFTFGLGVIWGL